MSAYNSFCTECGWRGSSAELKFDISAFLKTRVMDISETDVDYNLRDCKSMVLNFGGIFVSANEINEMANRGDSFKLSDNLIETICKGANDLIRNVHNLSDDDATDFLDKLKNSLARPEKVALLKHPENADIITQVNIGRLPLTRRYCPHCKNQVSTYSGVYREITLSVFGGPRASKTTTVCSTIWAIKNKLSAHNIEVQMEPDAKLQEKWKITNELLGHYAQNIKIDSTHTGDTESIIKCSFLISIAGERKYLISLIDIPGEFIRTAAQSNDDTLWEQYNKSYQQRYENLDYIWICVDKKVLDGGSRGKDGKERETLRRYGYDDGRPLSARDLIVALQKMKPYMSSLDGAALIWGKIDEDEPTMNEPFMFSNWGDYNSYRTAISRRPTAKYEAIKKQSLFVKTVIESHPGASTFVSDIVSLFKGKTCIFATSNYGHTPRASDTDGADATVKPFNTEFPIIWTLTMAGAMEIQLPGRRRIEYRFVSSDKDKKELLCFDNWRR